MIKIILLGMLVAFQCFALSNEELRKNEEIKRLKAATVLNCTNARTNLENHISQISRECKKKEDCTSQYINLSSCAPPYALNKNYKPDEDKELLRLQSEARTLCKDELPQQPVCSPIAINPVCFEGKCVSKNQLPLVAPVITKQDIEMKFSHAIKRDGCAPDDSISWDFKIYNKKFSCSEADEKYPVIYVFISGDLPKLPLNSPAKRSAKIGDMGLSSTFCKEKRSCVSAEQTELEMKSLDTKGGKGSLILTLPDGRKIKAQFEFENCKDTQMMCG